LNWIMLIIIVSMPLYLTAFILYLVRGIKGPTIFDSVIAIDAMCYDIAAFMVVLSVYFQTYLLLGVAVLMALWAYMLDVIIARYYVKEVHVAR